ncbi:unnamed protein product [Acanthoscelides obtectus]|uniref:Gustatory receptor n=1 Tax=Acanthoscelides obtectus TaxID=200917 RepID=A0A9P0LAG3_ACAOB|nr:unnamed protein product [Acanthoscelides obtectus]CAK1645972.1 hypothetical protein AOBTE_LOCUS14368 [Acanthoscelides obtectus]
MSIDPKRGMGRSNNVRDFLGIIRYKQCNGKHQQLPSLTYSPAELIEHFRMLHEDISLCIYSFNESLNPIFLFHIVIELTVLIINAYATVAYFVYTFKNPLASAIQMINYVFLLFHCIGMIVFLRNAQHLKNMVTGLINLLLEHSSTVSTLEEHQQIRLFIEKLKHHRHLSASGVFEINLGIAGPIAANILTYVLVALQFEVPQE